jgi:hypothetical protein
MILEEAHDNIVGGNYAGIETAQNIFCTWLCGPHFTIMLRNTFRHAMYVKEWENHPGGMAFL